MNAEYSDMLYIQMFPVIKYAVVAGLSLMLESYLHYAMIERLTWCIVNIPL